ncbi:MAG: hypothetical protein ACSHXA_17165 [Polaribacter sp.]|uniref:hypothetical protein n=1 Tax=Polaribacter sp. TaxID=1920175 RepID=UPI003EF9415F
MIFGITENTKKYKWDYLYNFELELFLASDSVKNLIQYQEDKLNEITEKLTKKNGNELNELNNPNVILDERLNTTLYIYHRYSSLVGVFSLLESYLKTICEELIKQRKTKKKIKNFYSKKEGYLQNYWDFLNAVYKLKDDKLLENFKSIKKKKTLRNIIVHNNGIAKKNQISNIQNMEFIKIIEEKNQVIICENNFLFNLINEINLFFRILLTEINEVEN